MEVAVLYSGGKDSTLAIEFCKEKGWNIKYLLSVKPTRTDCYLFHYATVEHTKDLAKILGIKHILVSCSVADPKKEAEIVKKIIEKNPVDAVVLGGVGLQITQLKSIQDALRPLKVEVFASHAEYDHEEIVRSMIRKGYKIMITQYACEGLNEDWLGKILNFENFENLKELAYKYGFHIGAEGGYWDSLVIGGPIFKGKELMLISSKKVRETNYSGYLVINKVKIINSKLNTHVYQSA